MPRNTKKVAAKMQDKYVEARIAGKTKTEAKEVAGYAPTTKTSVIERPDGPVVKKLMLALEAAGITEEKIASEYAKGLEQSVQAGARDADFGSHAKYLLQLGYLLGYGKQSGPSVAVQINNGTGSADEPDGLKATLGRIEECLEVVAAEIVRRDVPGVHDGDARATDAAAHDGVDQPAQELAQPRGAGHP